MTRKYLFRTTLLLLIIVAKFESKKHYNNFFTLNNSLTQFWNVVFDRLIIFSFFRKAQDLVRKISEFFRGKKSLIWRTWTIRIYKTSTFGARRRTECDTTRIFLLPAFTAGIWDASYSIKHPVKSRHVIKKTIHLLIRFFISLRMIRMVMK